MKNKERNLSAAEYLISGDIPLRLIRREPECEFPLHRHDFSELVIVFGGSGTHLTTGGGRKISAGDIFLIGNPGPHHGFSNTRNLALYNLLFDRGKVAELIPAQAYPVLAGLNNLEIAPQGDIPLHLEKNELEQLLKILREMEEEQSCGREYSAVALLSRFIILLVEIARICRLRSKQPDGRFFFDTRGGERFEELLSLMAEHPERELSREEMAERLCVSESTLQRIFCHRTGCSPHGYLMQLRLKKAEALLISSELSVSEIAAEVGFSDSNYFCRRFRIFSKNSPLEFRRKNRR